MSKRPIPGRIRYVYVVLASSFENGAYEGICGGSCAGSWWCFLNKADAMAHLRTLRAVWRRKVKRLQGPEPESEHDRIGQYLDLEYMRTKIKTSRVVRLEGV